MSSPKIDLSFLPQPLIDSARFVGGEVCWPASCAASVIESIADSGKIILGVEAWDLTEKGAPRVLAFSSYDAEDYLNAPRGVIASCRNLALMFLRNITMQHACIQVEWVSLEEWHKC